MQTEQEKKLKEVFGYDSFRPGQGAVVEAIHHIDRGYERFCEKLTAIGARVERDAIPDPEED